MVVNMENLVMQNSQDDKLLMAFVGKPNKFWWYKNAFAKYNVNGIKQVAWNWSWWSFFFGEWYLFYRKCYLASLAIIALKLLGVFSIGFGVGLVLDILCGGFLPYIVYRKYEGLKAKIVANISDENQQVEAMRTLGGYNIASIFLCLLLNPLIACHCCDFFYNYNVFHNPKGFNLAFGFDPIAKKYSKHKGHHKHFAKHKRPVKYFVDDQFDAFDDPFFQEPFMRPVAIEPMVIEFPEMPFQEIENEIKVAKQQMNKEFGKMEEVPQDKMSKQSKELKKQKGVKSVKEYKSKDGKSKGIAVKYENKK